jgi:hypothetical protein
MATTTNYSWSTPDDTALVKDGAAAIRSLGTAIDTTVFTNAGAAIAKTLIDAKGDLIVGSAADTAARLAVGTNDYVLTADSAATNGVKWAALPAAGGMTLIQETVASGNASISFGSIAGTYKQLLLTFHGLYFSNNSTAFSLRFNNSAVSEYSAQSWGFNQSSPTAQFISSTSTSAGMPTGVFGEGASNQNPYETVTGQILIDNYASTTKHKMYYGYRAYFFTPGAGEKQGHSVVGSWGNTSAITSLDIFRTQGAGTLSNIANTSIRLYGIS